MSDVAPKEMLTHTHAQRIVMVCVTRQKTCERLIAHGEAIAKQRGAPLHVVHAVKTGENFLGNIFEGEALEYLFTAAQLSNGDLAVLRADDVEATLREYAEVHNAAVLVMGKSPVTAELSFEARMRHTLPHTEVIVV